MNNDDDGHHHDTAFIDSTIQEKKITCPTGAKLHKKIVKKVLDIVKRLGFPLCQSYTFVLTRSIVTSVSGIITETGKKLLKQTNVYVQ